MPAVAQAGRRLQSCWSVEFENGSVSSRVESTVSPESTIVSGDKVLTPSRKRSIPSLGKGLRIHVDNKDDPERNHQAPIRMRLRFPSRRPIRSCLRAVRPTGSTRRVRRLAEKMGNSSDESSYVVPAIVTGGETRPNAVVAMVDPVATRRENEIVGSGKRIVSAGRASRYAPHQALPVDSGLPTNNRA